MAKKNAKRKRAPAGAALATLGRRALAVGALGALVFLALRFGDEGVRARSSLLRDVGVVLLALACGLGPGFTLVLLARWRRAAGRGLRTRAVWLLDAAAVAALIAGAWRVRGEWSEGLGATLLVALAAPWPALFLFAAARVVALRARAGPSARAPARKADRKVRVEVKLELPRKPEPTPAPEPRPARWIPPGVACEVAGITLTDGMLYVGDELSSVARPEEPEPALVRPDLPTNPDATRVRRPPHKPSYSSLPPSSRAAHLEWLASGRQDPEAELGYLLLFFYGLERRLLFDGEDGELEGGAVDGDEIEALWEELRRLRAAYFDQRAFRARVEALLDHVELEHFAARDLPPPQADEAPAREMPVRMKLALARAATRRTPLSPDWTRAWLAQATGGKLPTAARRAPAEFDRLFQARLAPRLARALEPPAGAPSIEVTYEPASPSLARRRYVARAAMPDPTSWKEPLEVLMRTAEECAEELAGFARWRAKHPQRSPDLAALATLPRELLRERDDALLVGLSASLEAALGDDPCVLFPARGLFARKVGERPSRKDCAQVAVLLGKLGYGLEPDVRFGGPRLELDERCALFRLPDGAPQAPSEDYEKATIVSHLATLVAGADGDAEEDPERSQLDAHLDAALELEPAERERIDAHHVWLASRPRKLAGLKRRVAELTPARRAELGRFVVQVAGADGRVDHAEIVMLERIHKLLGLDVERVHAELHALSTSAREPAAGTWEEEQAADRRGVELDEALVRRKLRETAQVSALLQGVFSEEEEVVEPPVPSAPATTSPAPSPPAEGATLAGLDARHGAFLRALVERASWPRPELEGLAETFELMLDGALDQLNEAAFERCDAPLWEGADPIEIDPQTAEELTR